MSENITKIGIVQNVTGSSVSITLDTDTISGLIFVDGQGYKIGQLGSFIRIPIGYISLYGIVSQVGVGAVPESLKEMEPYGNRWLTVQLIGESYNDGKFRRGLSQYPTIGEQVHIVTESDLERIYGQSDQPNYVQVGNLANSESIPALIDIDKLITRHCSVLGATGSGKSTTVAGLINSLSDLKQFPAARIIVFDIHGEYARAFKDKATVYRVNPNGKEKKLCIPYWALTFDELLSITFGNIEGAGRAAVVDKMMQLKRDVLQNTKYKSFDENSLNVDTPIPFSIHKLWLELYKLEIATYNSNEQKDGDEAYELNTDGTPLQVGDALKVIPPKYKPHKPGNQLPNLSKRGNNIRRQLEGLASKLKDPRYNFLFTPGEWLPDIDGNPDKDIDTLLFDWIGGEKPVTILDLSGIPSEILTTIVGAVLRVIYDALFWARYLPEGGRERPLFVVLEEAHSYLSKGNNDFSASIVKKIVKEGRKYGIGAMLVSQRPSELDATILSQCGTIFAMRLNNSTDKSHVSNAVTDSLDGLLNMLPILRTGEAIIIGESVNLPIRAIIKPPPANQRPDSEDPKVSESWRKERKEISYSDIVTLWREQKPLTQEELNKLQTENITNQGGI